MSTIRGLVFHSRFSYLKQHFEFATRKTIRDRLSEQARYLISEQVFPVNFYPFDILEELDEKIVSETGLPEAELFGNIGREFAQIILDRYFFNYIEARRPQRFLAQFHRLYERLWGFGKLEVMAEGQQKAALVFHFPGSPYLAYHIFMNAFLAEAIAICGGKDVQIHWTDTEEDGEACRKYMLEWQ